MLSHRLPLSNPISQFLLLAVLLGCSSQESTRDLQFSKSDQTFPGAATNQIALADLDDDGDLDAVFSIMQLDYSRVLMNDGTGQFVDSGQELTQQGHGLGVGDLDGDGDLDLFMTCAGWGEGGVEYSKPSKIYLNDGAGRFEDSGQDLGDTEPSGNSVDLFDYDSDGDLDAYVTYYQLPDAIYLNDGHGRFSDSGISVPENVSWVDLDSDGDVDMFVRERGAGFKTAINDGYGSFEDYWAFPDTTFTYVLAHPGDLDGDGDVDIVITHGPRSGSYPTRLFMNDGTGRFSLSTVALPSVTAGRIGIGDVNGDGDVDILLTSLGEPHRIWLGDGDGGFVDSGLRLENQGGFHSPLIRDLDDDGRPDLFVAHYARERGPNEIWFNQTR
jgi:hypothetical protein